MESEHHIFLSYSRRDSAMMFRIRDSLVEAGFIVWTDEKLTAGTPSWKSSIESAIKAAGCLVVILSPDAKESVWIERELDYANVLHKRIFPVLVAGDEATSIPFELVSSQYVDIRPDYDSAITRLCAAVRQHLQVNDQGGNTDVEIPQIQEKPKLPLHVRVKHTGRMMVWYFLRPNYLQRMKGLGWENAVTSFRSWMASSMIWLALLIPQIIAFPGTMYSAPAYWIFLTWLAIGIAWRYTANLGTFAPTRGSFLWQMFLRLLVLTIASLAMLSVYVSLEFVLFPSPNYRYSVLSNPLLYLAVMVPSLGFASLVGTVARLAGRFSLFILFLLLQAALFLAGYFIYFGGQLPHVGFVLSPVIGLVSYGVFNLILWRITSRRLIAQSAATLLSSGVVAIWGITFFLLAVGESFVKNVQNESPNSELALIVGATSAVSAFIISLTLFGMGSLFSVRRVDAWILGASSFVILALTGVAVGVGAGFLYPQSSQDAPQVSQISFILIALAFFPLVISMFAGGIVGNVLRSFAVSFDFIFVVAVTVWVSLLLSENAAAIGVGWRGIILSLTLSASLIQVFVHRENLPNFLSLLIVLAAGVGLVAGYSKAFTTALLEFVVLIYLITLIGGSWVARAVSEKSQYQYILTAMLLLLFFILPLFYGLNI